MYTLRALGVVYNSVRPAWAQWSPGQLVDPYDIPDQILYTWRQITMSERGYNAQQQCYCWGYRPADRPQTVDGSRWASQLTPWRICPTACDFPVPVPPPCPPQQACPTQTCPPQQACVCPAPTTCEAPQGDIGRNKNWLWLVGFGVLVTGVYGVRRTMALRRK
jgi:hypothetical protein